MDPSPFIEKDLDDQADEFIVSWARELPPDAPLKLRVRASRPADQIGVPAPDETGPYEPPDWPGVSLGLSGR